jgi:heptosyltransferase-2
VSRSVATSAVAPSIRTTTSGLPARTLVVMPNWVGDCVMALPVLDALAASGRTVIVLARRHLVPLLRLSPAVSDAVERAANDAATIEALRAAQCEEAIVLPNSIRAAWLPYQAGIPYRWGYRGGWRAPLLAPPVPRPRGRRLQVEDYQELLAALGVPAPPSWTPRLPRQAALVARGRERLQRARLGEGGPLVGLSPGAEWGPSKRWPWRRFADLANELRRQVPDVRQAILVGPKETWTGVRVHEESGKLHPVIGPDLDLAGLAAVLACFDLLVTNDSGPMHLAAAFGVPCVTLFGPTDPRRTAPAGDGHAVLWRDLWCSPCFSRRCPLLHHRCLQGIGVAEVAATVAERLAPGRAAG